MAHFPKEFLDLKAFNSNKAQAINDSDSSREEDFEQTAHGAKDQSINNRPVVPVENRLVGILEAGDNRLIGRPMDQVFSNNDNLLRRSSEQLAVQSAQ